MIRLNHADRFERAARFLLLILAASVGVSCAAESVAETESDAANGKAPASDYWRHAPAPADFDPQESLVAGFLIVDGVYNSELMAPYDIFHHTPFHTDPHPGIDVLTVSPDGQTVTSFEGLRIEPHYGFGDVPPIDILVVPSAEHSMGRDLENDELIQWVRKVGEEARFIVSLCDGAFVLAKAGLLDGFAVTTFPGDQDRFAEMFPELDLRRGVSFVHHGKAMTSAGGAKSYDVAMHLVDHLYGDEATKGVGGGLIIAWPPAPRSLRAIVVE